MLDYFCYSTIGHTSYIGVFRTVHDRYHYTTLIWKGFWVGQTLVAHATMYVCRTKAGVKNPTKEMVLAIPVGVGGFCLGASIPTSIVSIYKYYGERDYQVHSQPE